MRIVLGTADLREEPRTTQLLDRFYEAGGRAIDVANVYGEGKSERAVGSWLRRRGVRDVVLYSKGCHPPYCSPELVSAEVSQALALLGVDRVDVFMLHRDDPSVPVSAFADALQQEVAAGRIGGFGVSNWALTRFHELVDYSGGGGGPVAFSNHFSLGEMVTPTWPGCLSSTRDEVAAVVGDGAEFLAWAGLAMGYFAGREPPSWQSPENAARRARAGELAAELGTTANVVALAYILHQSERVRPVIGTRSEVHLDEALSAESVALTDDQIARLESG